MALIDRLQASHAIVSKGIIIKHRISTAEIVAKEIKEVNQC